jgi:hypothetical protein
MDNVLIQCYPENAIRGNSVQLKETNTSEAMVQQTESEKEVSNTKHEHRCNQHAHACACRLTDTKVHNCL